MDVFQRHSTELKTPDAEGHTWYDFIYTNCPEKANLQRRNTGGWLSHAEGMSATDYEDAQGEITGGDVVFPVRMRVMLAQPYIYLKMNCMFVWMNVVT